MILPSTTVTTTTTTAPTTTSTTVTTTKTIVELDISEIEIGKTAQINTNRSDLTFKSSNTDVAVVSKTGKITTIEEGTAIITAITPDGDATQFTITVTVPITTTKETTTNTTTTITTTSTTTLEKTTTSTTVITSTTAISTTTTTSTTTATCYAPKNNTIKKL